VLAQTVSSAAALGLLAAASSLALLAGRLPEHESAPRVRAGRLSRSFVRSLLVLLTLAAAAVALAVTRP